MPNTTTGSAQPAPETGLIHEQDTAQVGHAVPAGPPSNGHSAPPRHGAVPHPTARPRKSPLGKIIFLLVVAAGVGAFVAVRGVAQARVDGEKAFKAAYHFVMGAERTVPPKLVEAPAAKRFNGLLSVSKQERASLGLRIVPVEAQIKPIYLELNGTTDYDQNTMRKVRPLFDARVTQVFKSTGQMVKKGEPLVELYSTALAASKADFRSKYAQYQHDKRLLDNRRPLAKLSQISQVQWVDTYLAELTSRVGYIGAKDKLITYGISPDEIKRLEVNVSDDPNAQDDPNDKVANGEMDDISKLVLRAPIDGMIVERDVVSGNFYDDMAVLMVISPMDKLWVWGNVYEKDQGEVHLGQIWTILFPYIDLTVKGHVEHIDAKVDPNTRTLKIRATIPNPDKQLKAEQLVKATLEIPPVPGQTVIPRNAMAVVNGENCCFIQAAGDPDKFERRKIEIDQENHDFVVVKAGLKPGELVVTNGSLILSQLFEDESTVDTGMPMQ